MTSPRIIHWLLGASFLVAPILAQVDLVPNGATWRYLDDGSDQGTDWRMPSFDDSGWAQGPAQLGYGDGDEATVVSFGGDASQKHPTTYFRHRFQVANPLGVQGLEMRMIRDDGASVYLNGVLFANHNLDVNASSSAFATSTVSGSSEDYEFKRFADSSLLVAGENVLAVEVHQRNATSSDISFDLALVGHDEPAVLRGPYLQNQRHNATVVRWLSATPSIGAVWIGDSPQNLVQVASESSAVRAHEVEVLGLEPGARYFYGVGEAAASVPIAANATEYVITTPPEPGAREPFRAWVLGDSGLRGSEQYDVRDAYLAHEPGRPTDMILFLGDNAYVDGYAFEYQAAFFETYALQMSKIPSWSTRGNHERQPNVYTNLFSLPTAGEAGGVPSGTEAYYSFDRANVHFVCLDSFGSSRAVGGAMYSWLQADLSSTTQDWIIAFWHHPPYTKGSHDSDAESDLVDMRENFLPLLEDHGVSLVFGGHSHAYERSGLIDGHYGPSTTWNSSTHGVDTGDGRVLGTGAYEKTQAPHSGAVYVVAGSSSRTSSSGALDHPAMVHVERELGSVILDVAGGRIDVTFLDDVGAARDWFSIVDTDWDGRLCTGTVDAQGCSATVTTSGVPSVSSTAPFTVTASGLRTQAFGLCVYAFGGSSFAALPNGRLCLAQPLRRTAPSFSGGTGACTGSLQFDFSTIWSSPQHPGLVAGETLYCQFWHRDTGPGMSTLTEAVAFTLIP